MVLNTLTVGAAVTPTVTKTYISHYLNRGPLHQKPTAHISYDLGLHLVRRFVEYSALHTVEEIQAFTAQWVPAPSWVRVEDVEIPAANVTRAAEVLQSQLGEDGIEAVGGKEWWQWRRGDKGLGAEWIEMKSDWNARKASGEKGNRVMLYVHGGAYYFGSVGEHRYQMQRHARKLKAKCFAPKYRLAPQFPFPCGLHDAIAAYLYLLEQHKPSEIIVAGDSAGGGMVLSLLVVLRDQGIPLPAGGVLLSPWVDLMHSFPSICGSAAMDYIPGDGFIHKPSMAWPPPTLEDVKDGAMPDGVAAARTSIEEAPRLREEEVRLTDNEVPARDKERGYSITDPDKAPRPLSVVSSNATKFAQSTKGMVRSNMTGRLEPSSHIPSVVIDGKLVQIRDQIQMYAPNHLLKHPLVSPVLQPSLGGLPPIMIQAGGGELLRDEQIYIAHKMANPAKYPARKETREHYDPGDERLNKYKPTNVFLQEWEDMCHVPHTLSFTRPAKFMYRSVAQFGAWALAHAQQRPIDIPEDEGSDTDSVSSQEDSDGSSQKKSNGHRTLNEKSIQDTKGTVGKAGDPLPPFVNYMIRQRVTRHGDTYDMEPEASIGCLSINPEEIGILKEGPVLKWLNRQEKWNKKFAHLKRELQKKRAKQLEKGYVGLPEGERPPPTALAGMREKDLPKVKKASKSWGMAMWSGWGSKHDEVRVQQEKKDEKQDQKDEEIQAEELAKEKSRTSDMLTVPLSSTRSRSRSRSKSVMDEGQISGSHVNSAATAPVTPNLPAPAPGAVPIGDQTLLPPSDGTATTRPTDMNGIAYPFKLKLKDEDVRSTNASMLTLDSNVEAVTPIGVATPGGLATAESRPTTGVGSGDEKRPAAERFEAARES